MILGERVARMASAAARLQAMCGDLGYEVLDEIALLPARLRMLYRALTM